MTTTAREPSRFVTQVVQAELGRASGVFDAEVYAALILVIALTTLLPPFLLKGFYRRYGATLGV